MLFSVSKYKTGSGMMILFSVQLASPLKSLPTTDLECTASLIDDGHGNVGDVSFSSKVITRFRILLIFHKISSW